MSQWVHITAVLELMGPEYNVVGKSFDKRKQQILKIIHGKITGSEGPADVFISRYNYYNTSLWDGHKYINGDNRYIITIKGNLRDRDVWKTKEELKNIFGELLYHKYFIDDMRSIGVIYDGSETLDIVKIYCKEAGDSQDYQYVTEELL